MVRLSTIDEAKHSYETERGSTESRTRSATAEAMKTRTTDATRTTSATRIADCDAGRAPTTATVRSLTDEQRRLRELSARPPTPCPR